MCKKSALVVVAPRENHRSTGRVKTNIGEEEAHPPRGGGGEARVALNARELLNPLHNIFLTDFKYCLFVLFVGYQNIGNICSWL